MEGMSVPRLVSMLISEENYGLANGFAIIIRMISRVFEKCPEADSLVRLIQNLNAYKQGSMIRKLLSQLPRWGPVPTNAEYLTFRMITTLASSRLTSQFVIKEEGAEGMVARLSFYISNTLPQPLIERDIHHKILSVLVTSMEALLHFARCSKEFREALRSCKTLPQACCDALEIGKTLLEVPLESMRAYLAHLMANLALHADSRGWILDWGWLKVVADIYRSAPFEEMRHFTGNALIGGLQTLILNSDTVWGN
jgi:hypothetical protein